MLAYIVIFLGSLLIAVIGSIVWFYYLQTTRGKLESDSDIRILTLLFGIICFIFGIWALSSK